jgi:hypothetical protein
MMVQSYKVTSNLPAFPTTPSDGPSSLQAGAHPDAGSYSTYSYSSGTDDVKTALTNFAPGLLGNPESVPKCPETELEAGGAGCPAASIIGTTRLDVQLAFDTGIPGFTAGTVIAGSPGTLYNAELLGNEPGRLAAVTPMPPGPPIVSSIPFYITPRGTTDYGLTGILDNIARLDAVNTPFGVQNLQVHGLSFFITGSTNNYVRNPTSCGAQTQTGQAVSYEDTATVNSPNYTFTTTGCETEAFGPTVSMEVGDSGTTAFNGFPPLTVKITQPPGQSDIRNTKITLPIELNTNNPAYHLCTNAQADADACPANSKFGNATAHSPFLGSSLTGPVYLLQQTSSSLPGILIDLNGRAHVKIKTSTVLIGGKQIQSIATDSPQLPISDLTVALNGGRNTGVFLNRDDLCFAKNSTSKFKTVSSDVSMTGWSGKSTTQKVTAKVNGCGPGVTGKLTGATGSKPSLTVTGTKHPDAPTAKEFNVELSSNLSLVKSKLSKGASAQTSATLGKSSFKYVNKHTLRVTGLPSAGVNKLTLKLRKGAIRVSKRSRNLLRRGKSREFKVRVRVVPVSGKVVSTRTTFKVKGKKAKKH